MAEGERLQHVPRLGDRVTYDGHRFVVSAIDGRRIARIRVSLSAQLDRPVHRDAECLASDGGLGSEGT
ncbi:MAG TPA: transporter associated domain-containing protein [Aldersonia sp.]